MTEATKKNRAALSALLGSEALFDRLLSIKLAVVTSDSPSLPSAKILTSAVVDSLGRLWPNIDFVGHGADETLAVAVAAAQSGGLPTDGLRAGTNSKYDLAIAIGCEPNDSLQTKAVLRVAANDWKAKFGPAAVCGESLNPVGPALAATLCAAQVFLRVFQNELAGREPDILEAAEFDARELFDCPQLKVAPLDLGKIELFGVGAVTHAFIWLLENWPAEVRGHAALVDPDPYGRSNGQRYAFMRSDDIAKAKVQAVGTRLSRRHPKLKVDSHELDLNTYCERRGYDIPLERVVVGLDSPEARRQVALKMPARAINMWTGEHRAGASRYLPDGVAACLACDYLEDTSNPRDETAAFAEETGLSPDVVRLLLGNAHPLNAEQAQRVAAYRGVALESVLGAPIRSVRPILCATGRVQIAPGSEAIDVPFAFASFAAGLSGFMMLLKDLQPSAGSEGWSQNLFVTPTRHMRGQRGRRPRCVHCDEAHPEQFSD